MRSSFIRLKCYRCHISPYVTCVTLVNVNFSWLCAGGILLHLKRQESPNRIPRTSHRQSNADPAVPWRKLVSALRSAHGDPFLAVRANGELKYAPAGG